MMRVYILAFSGIIFLLVFFWIRILFPDSPLREIRLEQVYGILSILFLYITLAISPFYYVFPWFPGKKQCIYARRATGISSFYFALLHSIIAFFYQLHGFIGLWFLTGWFLSSIIAGGIALSILFVLAITSSDRIIALLTFSRWKFLHRLVYFAGILIFIHTIIIGTHFSSLSTFASQLLIYATAFLLVGEFLRLDAFLMMRFHLPRYVTFLLLSSLTLFSWLVVSYSIDTYASHTHISHAGHEPLALILKTTQEQGYVTIQFHIINTYYQQVQHVPLQTLSAVLVSDELTSILPLSLKEEAGNYTSNVQIPGYGKYYLYVIYQSHIPEVVSTAFIIGNPAQVIAGHMMREIPIQGQEIDTHMITLSIHRYHHTTPDLFTIKNSAGFVPVSIDTYGRSLWGYMGAINQQTHEYIYLEEVLPSVERTDVSSLRFAPVLKTFAPGNYVLFFIFFQGKKLHTVTFPVHV